MTSWHDQQDRSRSSDHEVNNSLYFVQDSTPSLVIEYEIRRRRIDRLFPWASFVPGAADELWLRHVVQYHGLRSENTVIPVQMLPDI